MLGPFAVFTPYKAEQVPVTDNWNYMKIIISLTDWEITYCFHSVSICFLAIRTR